MMPTVLLNLDALSHNTDIAVAFAKRWGVTVLPVLKAVASHPIVAKTLMEQGITRFGFAECDEPYFFTNNFQAEKHLLCLTPPRQADAVVANFSRNTVTTIEMLQALQQAAHARGKRHEVLVMIDFGDSREGIHPHEAAAFIECASAFPNLSLCGFGSMFACFGAETPTQSAMERMTALRDLFKEKGIANPVVSAGGSVFCAWVESNGPGPITELRFGDPFLLGVDLYRQAELPGGSYRQDVCRFCAEVLEVREKKIAEECTSAEYQFVGQDSSFLIRKEGLRRRALLDIGFFHIEGKELQCELPGTFIAGCSSGYLALDVTDCPEPVAVGQQVFFSGGYWSMSKFFRSTSAVIHLARD